MTRSKYSDHANATILSETLISYETPLCRRTYEENVVPSESPVPPLWRQRSGSWQAIFPTLICIRNVWTLININPATSTHPDRSKPSNYYTSLGVMRKLNYGHPLATLSLVFTRRSSRPWKDVWSRHNKSNVSQTSPGVPFLKAMNNLVTRSKWNVENFCKFYAWWSKYRYSFSFFH